MTNFYKYYCQYIHNGMSSIKIVKASQATGIYQYKNIMRKKIELCLTNFDKYYCKKMCLQLLWLRER